MTDSTHGAQPHGEPHIALPDTEDAPLDRHAALQEIMRLVEQWQVGFEELVDPAERQAALGNARRLVDFWQIRPRSWKALRPSGRASSPSTATRIRRPARPGTGSAASPTGCGAA